MIADIVTLSTSRFNIYGSVLDPDLASDQSGRLILDMAIERGHRVRYYLLPDGIDRIRNVIYQSDADFIVFCGGTGLTSLDLTIEAVMPLFEKTLPGFGEIFRFKSLAEVGTRAMLTRAAAGIIRSKPVFCLPGSPNAARLGISLILDEIEHIQKHIQE